MANRDMPARRLAQKATAVLLKGLRQKQSFLRNGKAYQQDEAQAVTANLELESEQGPYLPPLPQHTTVESANVLGKRRSHFGRAMAANTITIHEDVADGSRFDRGTRKMSVFERGLNSARQVGSFDQDSDTTESDEELDESVLDDMRKLEESFTGISSRYRLVNRIGEGTFSTVYKAEQLEPGIDEDNENDPADDDGYNMPTKRRKLANSSSTTVVRRRKKKYVALKKIYVTSSPHRILNELELLHELRRNSDTICPLLTAFRHQDQVIAVLPYFRHLDFRLYYQKFITMDIRSYMQSILSGLHHVHEMGIIHRDIKPTNFLYDVEKKKGVLVDFGLAEREGVDWQHCLCREDKPKRRERFLASIAHHQYKQRSAADEPLVGYPKHDNRPSRRANRAGTRGFRAPEVLFKCTAQTTKIDIWSAGVILLTILARRFPFFNSSDDVDATIEIASIFGRKKMQGAAALHGQLFETTIETIGEKGFTLEKIIRWASCREKREDSLHDGELQAIDFLVGLLELDPHRRMSAQEALKHEFFEQPAEDAFELEVRMAAESGQTFSDSSEMGDGEVEEN